MERSGAWLAGSLMIATLVAPGRLSSGGDKGPAAQPPPPVEAGSSAGSSPDEKAAAAETVGTEQGARKRYRQQLKSLTAQGCVPRPADPQSGAVEKDPASCGLKPDQFYIALVPDPVHTHLALTFDRRIETIQEALQDAQYSFVRAQMPWDSHSHPESADIRKRLAAAAYHEAREELPGLMAFRRELTAGGSAGGPPAEDWRFVWIVGETPTGGINEKQFRDALGMTADACGAPQLPQLKILGPTFSGSLPSLGRLLSSEARSRYVHALIFSGSANSYAAITSFLPIAKRAGASFLSFEETDEVMIERFQEFVRSRLHADKADSIALLSEDETTYGSFHPLETGQDQTNNGSFHENVPGRTGSYPQRRAAHAPAYTRILNLYFPREISQLRNAYQSSGPHEGESAKAPSTVLPLNLEVSGDDDTIAAFSHRQTPLSQEAVLLGIVSELRKHFVRYIVLRATDPLDLLFLSRYLGAAYPQGRIVTLGADALFGRGLDETPQLHGVLALATYSLAPIANHEFQSFTRTRTERVFPSSTEAGTYNALLALIHAVEVNDPDVCDPNAPQYPLVNTGLEGPLYLYQYGWRECSLLPKNSQDPKCNVPPVRLLALGHDEYWPVAHLGPLSVEAKHSRMPAIPGQLPPTVTLQLADGAAHGAAERLRLIAPTSWRLAALAAVVLAAGFVLSVWYSSIRFAQQPLAQLAPAAQDARGPLVCFSGLVLTGAAVTVLWPLQEEHWNVLAPTLLKPLLWMAAVLPIAAGAADTIGRRKKGDGWRMVWQEMAFLSLAVGLVAVFATSAVPESDAAIAAGVRRFAALRSLHMTSGLSPILPLFLLLAAGLWWAYHIAAGCALTDARLPRLPQLPEGVQLPEGERRPELEAVNGDSRVVAKLVKALRPEALRPEWSWAVHYLLLAGLVYGSFVVLFSLDGTVMTLEGALFEVPLLPLALALAVAGVLGTSIKLLGLWMKARNLLVTLDSLRLRRGFEHLQGYSWKPFWRLGLASLSEFQRLAAREREAMAQAMNTLPELFRGPLRQEIHDWRKALLLRFNASLELERPWTRDWLARRRLEREVVGLFGEYQEALAKAAGLALAWLGEVYRREKEEAPARPSARGDLELQVRACERFVCTVYVKFMLVVLWRIRTLVVALGGMYILLVLAMTCYPFQPKATIDILLLVLFVWVVAVVTLVFAQLHRDATLSHITNTTPGELGADFWVRTGSFVALPLFSLVLSQFPQVNRLFYSWLEPALQALQR